MAARFFHAFQLLAEAKAQDERNHLRRTRSDFRRRFDPFLDLGDTEFRNRYRLSKEAVFDLCQELEELTELKGTQQVSLKEKVLTVLFYYASGSHQRPVGVAKHFSQKMCSVYINEVTQALIHPAMLEKYIVFPDTPAARQAVSQKFYIKYGVPGVVGCIDGSHFKIFTPPQTEEHLYYCRKHYHSINVQMVCDSDYRILNINPKFGGHNHDAFVWENSQMRTFMENLHLQGEVCWLLGDSGYPQRPWLMTPFLDMRPDSPEAFYNKVHMTTRVVIENTFGRLKNRWRCLSMDHTMHYRPEKCAKIIQACCVLHNFLLNYNLPEPENQDEAQQPQPVEVMREVGMSTDLLRGRALRDQLVTRLWDSRL